MTGVATALRASLSGGKASSLLTLARPIALTAVAAGVLARTGVDLFAARSVGADGFAAYALLITLATITSGLVVVGLPGVALQVVPQVKRAAQGQLLLSFERLGTVTAGGVGVLVGAILWGGLELLEPYAYARTSAWLLPLLIPASAWLVFQRQLGLLSDRPLPAMFSTMSLGMLTTLLVFAGFALTTGVALFLGAFGMASLLIAGYLRYGFRRSVDSRIQGAGRQRPPYRYWLRRGVIMLGANFATVLTLQADVLLIWLFASPAEAGAYALASRLSMAVTLGLAAVIAQDSRTMGQKFALLGNEGLWTAYLHARRASVVLSGVLGLGLLVLSQPVLLAFGSEFTVAAPWFAVLILSRMASGFTGPVAEYLVIAGKSSVMSATAALGLTGTVATIVLLGAAFGPVGVALGTLVGTVVTNLLQLYMVRRYRTSPASLAAS